MNQGALGEAGPGGGVLVRAQMNRVGARFDGQFCRAQGIFKDDSVGSSVLKGIQATPDRKVVTGLGLGRFEDFTEESRPIFDRPPILVFT